MRVLKIENETTGEKFLFNLEQVTIRYVGNSKLIVHTMQGIYFQFESIRNGIAPGTSEPLEIFLYDSIADSYRHIICKSSRVLKGGW